MLALPLGVGAGCGDAESGLGRALSASDGTSGGSGATMFGSASGGSGGSVGTSGAAGTVSAGGVGGGATATVDGAGGVGTTSVGAGGSLPSAGAAGDSGVVDECADLPTCDSAGFCDGNTLVHCIEDANGCLIEMRTDCGEQICLEAESARCENEGHSCEAARQVSATAAIRGESFATDFSDGQAFAGEGCPSLGAGATDAVFEVQVPAGQTIVITEVGEHYGSVDTSIDASFAVMSGCGDEVACLSAGGARDTLGVSYTAQVDETVYVWVGAEAADQGSYEIHIEYATDLGRLELGESIAVNEDAKLERGELRTYLFELAEDGVAYGRLNVPSGGDVDLAYLYNDAGELVFGSLTFGSEDFAVPLETGNYRMVIFAYYASNGYRFDISADRVTDLGSFDVGDSFVGDFAEVVEGRSEFYRFFLPSTANIDWMVTNTESGSVSYPELSAYYRYRLLASDAGTDATARLFGTANPGAYVLRVLAPPGGGEIPAHQLELSFQDL